MAKQIVNVHPTGYKNTGEMTINGSSSTDNVALNMEERFFLGSSLVIYTGTGGSGIALTLNTDYIIGKKSEGLSDTVGLSVYGGIYITNATYQNVDLYIPDNTLTIYGDYVDASDINGLTQISLVDVEDGGTYTPDFLNAQLVGDTTAGDAAITIGDGAFLGQELTLSNQGTGFATFTHPDFSYGIIVDTDHNPAIKWVSDGVGGFKWDVGSQISADYVSGSQSITLYSNKDMEIAISQTLSITVGTASGSVYRTGGGVVPSVTYSREFSYIESKQPDVSDANFWVVNGTNSLSTLTLFIFSGVGASVYVGTLYSTTKGKY